MGLGLALGLGLGVALGLGLGFALGLGLARRGVPSRERKPHCMSDCRRGQRGGGWHTCALKAAAPNSYPTAAPAAARAAASVGR